MVEFAQARIGELLSDKERNLLEIARLLAYINSVTLPEEIRKGLDLPEEANSTIDEDKIYPTLFKPERDRLYRGLCPNSEAFLSKAFYYLKDPDRAPLYFLGCLLSKKEGILTGICFRTTEFPNGATFLRGIWYRARTKSEEWDDANPRSLFNKARALSREQGDHIPDEDLTLDLHPKYPSTVNTRDLVIWQNIGACWEPAREFNKQERFARVSEG